MSSAAKSRALLQYRAAFARYLEAIDENWRATIDGSDAEALHDLRVGVRRTRSLLADANGVVARPGRERFRALFRELAKATTSARDLDVAVADWPHIAPLIEDPMDALEVVHVELCRRQRDEHAALAATLQSADVQTGLDEWRSWLAAPPSFDAKRSRDPIKQVVKRRRQKSRKQLARLAKVDTAEGRHEWRKAAKRLRYLVEAFAHKRDRKLVARLIEAQDALGRQRDRLVQARIIESFDTDAARALAHALRELRPPPDPRF